MSGRTSLKTCPLAPPIPEIGTVSPQGEDKTPMSLWLPRVSRQRRHESVSQSHCGKKEQQSVLEPSQGQPQDGRRGAGGSPISMGAAQ